MTYTVLLDDLARAVDAHTVAAAVAQALGRDVSLPDWGDARDRFDAGLAAEPVPGGAEVEQDTAKTIMLRALGLSN